MRIIILFILIVIAAGCMPEKTPLNGQSGERPNLTPEAVQSWRNQKFSMFIHFGLYSVPGGVWKNQPVTKGYSEQIRAHGQIPREEYAALAKKFNPVEWNPDSVALLAKSAGMRSIVITAKHHDGFSMFHTRQSNFNIVDATPYKKDLIKELSDACRRHGIRFGVYFSLIDWNFPGALPISDHNSDSIPAAHHAFNMKQVEELATGYGPISEIWFDMGKPTLQQSKDLAMLVRRLQPDCMISGRLWNDQGDFAVMGDNASPDFRMGTLWQTPASMFHETWGFRSWQVRSDVQQKANEKIRELVRTVANGGNYLLNIGPEGSGRIVPFEKQVLMSIGKWMQSHGRSLYDTEPLYQFTEPAAFITRTSAHEGDTGILHLFADRQSRQGKVRLKGIRGRITSCRLISEAGSIDIPFELSGADLIVTRPLTQAASELFDDIEIRYPEPLEFIPPDLIQPSTDGSTMLSMTNGTRYHSYSGPDYYTTRATLVKMEWTFKNNAERSVEADLSFRKEDSGKSVAVLINGQPHEFTLTPSGEPDQQQNHHLKIPETSLQAGINRVSLALKNQSNPHQDMGLSGLVIRIP